MKTDKIKLALDILKDQKEDLEREVKLDITQMKFDAERALDMIDHHVVDIIDRAKRLERNRNDLKVVIDKIKLIENITPA